MLSRSATRTIVAAAAIAGGTALLAASGFYLVIDRPQKADAIVVLAGDLNDRRYEKGVELLRQDYAGRMLLDANTDVRLWGRTPAELASGFIAETAGELAPRVSVCPNQGDSTFDEVPHVAACLAPMHCRRVLLVTSDFHTRRALSIFSHRLPQYEWSVAAARDEYSFDPRWWKRREWAKTNFWEWLRLIWWQAVERWGS